MKAILVKQRGGPENLVLAEYPSPVAEKGSVLVQIKAFGINHAELYMRSGKWGETTDIIGIECVGVVVGDPSGEYRPDFTRLLNELLSSEKLNKIFNLN